jgi:hypothetical protein
MCQHSEESFVISRGVLSCQVCESSPQPQVNGPIVVVLVVDSKLRPDYNVGNSFFVPLHLRN